MQPRRALCLAILTLAVSPVLSAAVHFTSGHRALAIPFQLDDGHIYLRVTVNGSPPLSFLLDTGASHTVLDLRHARSFGMTLQPLDRVTGGVGARPPESYLVTDTVTIALPGAVFSDDTTVAIPLDQTRDCVARPGESKIVDGILGKDFFSHVVVELDYQARRINLYAPDSYAYKGIGKAFPLEIDSQFIFLQTQVKAAGRPPTT